MRIKRLEVLGFKSFKDKTVINFDEGITGVVGPNGCGKSNVVDAFFWALGEQNPRNLRGQTMSDLIFSGTDKSPPGNMAEVTLILEMAAELSGPNAPAGASRNDTALMPITREVAVTRRLYRSGDSEYFINKVPCRMRDIQELFMDTGAGARGYSIIQQGKIAEIVQAKPEDRRTMIEDVAGVVKYKARRRESTRKLESTRTNLERVSDVLTEIERQKRQLERQAEKARKYKEWKTQLQELDLKVSSYRWEEVAALLTSSESEIEDLNIQTLALETERASKETAIEERRLEATHAGKQVEELQSSWVKLGQSLTSTESTLGFKEQYLEDLRKSAVDLEAEAEQEKSQIGQFQAEFERSESEAQNIDQKLAEASERCAQAQEEADLYKTKLNEIEKEFEAQQKQLWESTSSLSNQEYKLESTSERINELKQKLVELEEHKASRVSELESLRSENNESQAALEKAQSESTQANQELENNTAAISSAQEQLDGLRKSLNELESTQVRQKTTLETLEDQKRRHEGSDIAVKTIFQKILKENSALESDVLGTLSDLIEVDNGKEVAVEAALGNYLNLVLTATEKGAEQIIAALSEQSSGRATIAILDAALNLSTTKTEINTPESSQNVLGNLTDFVRLNTTENVGATNLLKHLLGKTILVDELKTALALAKQNPEHNFVSLNGELALGTCFVSGGDAAQISGAIVARNREITELHEQLNRLQGDLSAAQNSLQAQEEVLVDLRSKKAELDTNIQSKNQLLSESSSTAARTSATLAQAEQSLEEMLGEMARTKAEAEGLELAITGLESEIKDLSELKVRLTQSSEQLQKDIEPARAELERTANALTQAKVHEGSVQEQKNTTQSLLDSARDNLERAAKRVEHLLEQAMVKQQSAEDTVEEIATLKVSKEELKSQLIGSEESLRTARDRLDKISHELDEYRQESQNASDKGRKLGDKINSKKLALERYMIERETLAQNTLDRYGVELGEYVRSPEVLEQVDALRAEGEQAYKASSTEVEKLRDKIRKLGEVNTGAIDEFDTLTERYNFLVEQKSDLEKSITDLQTTINKINKISKDRFFKAFEEVNEQFVRVFPALFGGGSAQLTLTDPDEFTETGVDIMAQPPGKKLQNINLLSGGEKTLTAISLLFSIFLIKPSPFCLLDEVDAPLDDANIGRFNALLREMAKKSQFIIITHNKRTMELNDKLYGVTMEDAGVSKMVSIQLQ